MAGDVIVLNGTSTAGKSTLAAEMQAQLVAADSCWIILGIDDFQSAELLFGIGGQVPFDPEVDLGAREAPFASDFATGQIAAAGQLGHLAHVAAQVVGQERRRHIAYPG